MIEDFVSEYARYRAIGERAMTQVSDEALNRVLGPDGNSIAMLVRHLSGNFSSRFTDFLGTDGEKPWRQRDAEFETRPYTRAEVDTMWTTGWGVVEGQLAALTDAQMTDTVRIRGTPFTVHAALARSLSHAAYHVGQMVLLARLLATDEWRWISIPKGGSDAYNRNPTGEKGPQ